MQGAKGAALPGDEQTTAGVAVQAMDELEGFVGAKSAKRFDHAVGEAAAAMHGNPRGLIENDQALVFADDGAANLVEHLGGSALGRGLGLDADGGDAYFVARLE